MSIEQNKILSIVVKINYLILSYKWIKYNNL